MIGFWMGLLTFLLVFVGFLLMFIVLLQRGRGGGLAGAFGGLGGQSAFGTKAGDVFTRITVVLAVIWVVLAGVTGFAMRSAAEGEYRGGAAAADRRALENPGDEGAGTIIPPPKPKSDAMPAPGKKQDEGGGPDGEAKGKPPAGEANGKSPAGAADANGSSGKEAADAKGSPQKEAAKTPRDAAKPEPTKTEPTRQKD